MSWTKVVVLVALLAAGGALVWVGSRAVGDWREGERREFARQSERLANGPFVEIDAAGLVASYRNQAAADARFVDQVLRVSGRVRRVSKRGDATLVHLAGATLVDVVCVVGDYEPALERVRELRPGDRVVARGFGAGVSMGDPALRDCFIEP
jgi:hypothetical protein